MSPKVILRDPMNVWLLAWIGLSAAQFVFALYERVGP